MIKINLLPYRAARKKEDIRFQVNVFVGSVVLLGLIIFWYNMLLDGKIKDLRLDIQSTRDQVAKYEKINKEIAEIKSNLSLLETKIRVIQSLELDRKAPVKNLDSIYKVLVQKRMWYTNIEEKGENIKVSGVALDEQTVADYMVRVEKEERFDDVRLASVKLYKLKDKEELDLKQFDVNIHKRPYTKDELEEKK